MRYLCHQIFLTIQRDSRMQTTQNRSFYHHITHHSTHHLTAHLYPLRNGNAFLRFLMMQLSVARGHDREVARAFWLRWPTWPLRTEISQGYRRRNSLQSWMEDNFKPKANLT